jgi:hypothetical protein
MNDDESTLNDATVQKPKAISLKETKVKNSCGPILKPCPFCGTIPTLNDDTFIYNPIIDDSVIDEHIIFCPNAACGVAPCLCGFNIPQMVETWNSRNTISITSTPPIEMNIEITKGWTNKL